MAERPVLPGKSDSGRVGGHAGQRGGRAVSGHYWQAASGNGSFKGGPGGDANAAPHAPQAAAVEAPSQNVGARGPIDAAGAQDHASGTDATVDLNAICPACGGGSGRVLFEAADRLYHTTTKTFQIVQCGRCGLIRLEPRPCREELRSYYPQRYWFSPEESAASRLEEKYRRLVLRDHVAFVRQALRNSGEDGYILDVGCGGGLFLRLLPHRPAIGLDNSIDAARVAWKQNGVPVFCGDLAAVPLPSNSCSVVTMFHVLEHLPDPVPYLTAARRLLRPNGRLVVQVPNASCWQFMLLGEHWNGIDVPRHLVNYRRRDLERLLEFCGFTTVRRKHFSLRDNPPGLATSIAPGLDPMARRVRGVVESTAVRLLKDAAYFGLTLASLPFTIVEAACGAGSTIMIEARRKS